MAINDKIIIRDLELIAYHGVFPEEKFLGQKFLVSLEITTDLHKAGRSGKLDDSINYGAICEDVEELFVANEHDLIESAATSVADGLFYKYDKINSLMISIKKPWAPVHTHLDTVEIQITFERTTVYLSLGSNIGSKKANLDKAIDLISDLPNTKLIATSKYYNTEPFGYTEQEEFVNCCVAIETILTPQELLVAINDIEKKMGRNRENAIKWGPRIIDIDIILFGDKVIHDENLVVPHPWMQDRAFVLEPLAEIAPLVIHPVFHRNITQLWQDL